MSHRRLRVFVIMVVLGSVAPVGGCGTSDEGTQVQVDKEKEAVITEAMGNYMQKNQPGKTRAKAKPDQ